MRLRAPCTWLRLGIAILLLEGASGWAFAVELQKFDPARCENNDHQNDKDCVRNWYAEYSAGVISEFKYYAGLEDFLAEMLADPQETLLTAKLSLILIEGGTKYTQWAVLTDKGAAESAELDMPRYEAIVGVCRDAIAECAARFSICGSIATRLASRHANISRTPRLARRPFCSRSPPRN